MSGGESEQEKKGCMCVCVCGVVKQKEAVPLNVLHRLIEIVSLIEINSVAASLGGSLGDVCFFFLFSAFCGSKYDL